MTSPTHVKALALLNELRALEASGALPQALGVIEAVINQTGDVGIYSGDVCYFRNPRTGGIVAGVSGTRLVRIIDITGDDAEADFTAPVVEAKDNN